MGIIKINNRKIGTGHPVYIVAEMSANHNQDYDTAVKIIQAAREAGADAIKLQTYTPDTMTLDCDNDYFRIKGTIWDGKTLYQLYQEAYTPWEWHPRLQKTANDLGLDFFSTPFDSSAVDFLEEMNVPVYKVASFELVDLPLLKKIGATGKPVIMSTGMASLAEIDEAVTTLRKAGSNEIALLKCTSAYPARPSTMNLKTIPHLAATFAVATGLSDHTTSTAAPIAAVVLEACIIEKHLTLDRKTGGTDSKFSLEPHEFKTMIRAIRDVEQAVGDISYTRPQQEDANRIFRRSLFATENIDKGEIFTSNNTRSIRPGHGLAPRYLDIVLGKRAIRKIKKGTPLSWNQIA
ncbi:pseudaminic acid synthase [Desulfobacterota bacterium M19]